MKFLWKPEFAIGVSVIDEQHQTLFSISEQLDHILFDSHNPILLGKILHEIVDYTQYHFTEEEKLMEAISYPLLSQHHDLHAQISNKIRVELQSLKEGHHLQPFELVILLNEWVTEHIMVEDMKIAAAYRADLLSKEQEFANGLIALQQKYEILHEFHIKGVYPEENYIQRKENIAKKYCDNMGGLTIETVKILVEKLNLMESLGIANSEDRIFFQKQLASINAANSILEEADIQQQVDFTRWLKENNFLQAINPDKL